MSDAENTESSRPLATLLIPLVVFGMAAIGLATVVQRRAGDGALPPVQATLVAVDSFDRSETSGLTGLDGLPGGLEWTVADGTWAIDLGKAYVTDGAADGTFAIIDNAAAGSSISIKAAIGGSDSCGVVARYVDANNFISLTHLPAVGVWALSAVKDGQISILHTLTAQRLGDVTIQLTVGPNLVSVTAGSQTASVTEPSSADERAGGVGMYAATAPSDCTWDDVVVTASG